MVVLGQVPAVPLAGSDSGMATGAFGSETMDTTISPRFLGLFRPLAVVFALVIAMMLSV
ncbi:hypothetical protein [Methanopyrus sp.]